MKQKCIHRPIQTLHAHTALRIIQSKAVVDRKRSLYIHTHVSERARAYAVWPEHTMYANTIVDVHRSCRKNILFASSSTLVACSVPYLLLSWLLLLAYFFFSSSYAPLRSYSQRFLSFFFSALHFASLLHSIRGTFVCSSVTTSAVPKRVRCTCLCACVCVLVSSRQKYIFWFLVCCDRIVVDSLSSSHDEKIIFSSYKKKADILLSCWADPMEK